jgi:hypothetical protein
MLEKERPRKKAACTVSLVAGFLIEGQVGCGGLCVVWGALGGFAASGGVAEQTGARKQVGCDLRILGDLCTFEMKACGRRASLGISEATGLCVEDQGYAMNGRVAFALFVKAAQRGASGFFLKCTGFF